jgi:hypothetical protein
MRDDAADSRVDAPLSLELAAHTALVFACALLRATITMRLMRRPEL